MTPELTRLLIVILLSAALVWAIASLLVMAVFGVPSRVPTPPVSRPKTTAGTGNAGSAPPPKR